MQITLAEKIDLGEEFSRWMIASATVAALMNMDPFTQPEVQESKDNTNRILADDDRSWRSPTTPIAETGNLGLFPGSAARAACRGGSDFRAMLAAFMSLARPGDYFAILAYVSPNPTVDKEIAAIRKAVVEHCGIATTFGYGPRYLHSTGQLHKGGPNTGLFLQITQDYRDTIDIPGVQYDFAQLNYAQYIGDFEALEARGRRVIRVHLAGDDPIGALEALRREIVAAVAK